MRKKTYFTCAFSLLLLAANAAAEDDGPTIAKDSVQVTAFTLNEYHKSFDVWSWVPRAEFRVNGPIASGSQLYVEFSIPGSAPVKFDCKTGEVKKGRYWKTDCGARDIPDDKATTYTGTVNFAIHLRNELSGGADLTLFTGKMKVAKAHSNEHGPKMANHFVYYVDQDWNLPIGYLFLSAANEMNGTRPQFTAVFWFRGDGGGFEPHLFYQGKEVGKMFFGNMEAGKASCSATEVEDVTTHYVEDAMPQKAKWSRVACVFPNVQGAFKAAKPAPIPGQVGAAHLLPENPGDYEVKVLWKGHLSRSIKFTVSPEGKFGNEVATANKLGSHRTIVPVQIIGDQDGAWNRDAWKTDAFYGNPLTGFTALP